MRLLVPVSSRQPSSLLYSSLRHFSVKADRSVTVSPPLLRLTQPESSSSSSSLFNQVLTLIQTHENDWNTNEQLQQLLFCTQDTLSPSSLLRITRQLGNATKALQFFNYIRTNSPSTLPPSALSSAFQAVFELASVEKQPDSLSQLHELFNGTKEHNIPLTINSAILLIRCFGRAGMVERSLLVYNELDPDARNTNIRNVLLDCLLRSGRVDDGFKLLDEMLERDSEHSPNDVTMNIVMTSIVKQRFYRNLSNDKIVGLLKKFAEHGVFPDAGWLTMLINKFCKSGASSGAWDMLHDVMRLGGHVSTISCNALLTWLGREHNIERMNFLLKEMKEKDIRPNVVTFGILINQLCKTRRVDDALEVFKKMIGEDECDELPITPDVILYNTLIDGLCRVGKQEEGLGLMEQMRSKHGCMPNTATYNCLIGGFCKSGEIDMARKLFDQMIEEGIFPNVITMNTLVDGMCKHGRINGAMEFFNWMQGKGLKGNAVTYTALINAFCYVNNIAEAKKLFDEMLKEGCSPDAILYYTFISGLTQAGKLDEADSVIATMKQAGFCLDIVCYNTLIAAFCRKNKLDKAYEMLRDMEQCKVKADIVTYNTLISHFSVRGDFTTARKLMKNMIDDGLVATVVTFGALIHAYCLAGKIDEAMKILTDMSSSKVRPNTVIYNMLIVSLCKVERVNVALSLMRDMKDQRIKPNTATYNAIFKGLQHAHWLEKAFELMDQMIQNACNPDYVTMETLTEWLTATGETEKLKSFVQGYQVSPPTL